MLPQCWSPQESGKMKEEGFCVMLISIWLLPTCKIHVVPALPVLNILWTYMYITSLHMCRFAYAWLVERCWFVWVITAGVDTVLTWSILFVEESCSIHEVYEGIQSGSVDVPSSRHPPVHFPHIQDCPLSCVIRKKPMDVCYYHRYTSIHTLERNTCISYCN